MHILVAVLDLAGSVALLLWGIHMVQTGIQRAFGAELRLFLSRALQDRLRAFMAGLGVTALLQSSTATALMVTGFAAGGFFELVPALAAMLGANVGTTLIVQLLSFDVAEVTPVLMLAGFVMFQKLTAGRKDFGRVLIGLALLLMALHQFVALLESYDNEPQLRMLLAALSTQPVLDVLLGALLTWAAHSSVAVVLLTISFAAQGTVAPEAAFALVLGANLGTAINPVLEGVTGGDPAARRLPLGNLFSRLIGVAVALAALPWIGRLMLTVDPNHIRVVADFHSAFNITLALVFLPLLGPYAAVLRVCLPARINESDPGRPLYLDTNALATPVVAIGASAREALRMTDVLETLLQGFRDVLEKPHRHLIAENKRIDDILDKLNAAIKDFLVSIEEDAMSEGDQRRVREILAFATHIEQAGDIIDRNLLDGVSRKLKRGLSFSQEGKTELLDLTDRLLANLRQAASLFMTEDLRAARLLANEKKRFRDIEYEATASHFTRMRQGRPETMATSALHLDILRDLKAVNSHIVAAVAYPILERASELLPDRLKDAIDADCLP